MKISITEKNHTDFEYSCAVKAKFKDKPDQIIALFYMPKEAEMFVKTLKEKKEYKDVRIVAVV